MIGPYDWSWSVWTMKMRLDIDDVIEARNFRPFGNRPESFLATITACGGGVCLTCSSKEERVYRCFT